MVLVASQEDQRQPVDALVYSGPRRGTRRPCAAGPSFDHALGLFKTARLILVTGGVGRGDTTSNRVVGRRYLIAHGVPEEAVVAQSEGRTTHESMTAVTEWLYVRGLRRVLLVSDPFHMFRLQLEARRTEHRGLHLADREQPHLQ